MQRFLAKLIAPALLTLALAVPAAAHFGMIIPDLPAADMNNKSAMLEFSFSHPFAGVGMDMVRPNKAGVAFQGKITDLKKRSGSDKNHGPRRVQRTIRL